VIPAVVMAGGEGTRLRPLTTSLPKPLLPVLNRPMLEHVLRLLSRHGVTDAVITVQFLASLVRSFTGDGSDVGMRLTYVTEDVPLGTAGSVKNAEAELGRGAFLVISGDAITDIDLTALIEHHRSTGADVTMCLARTHNPVEFGGVVLDEQNRVLRLVEKPGWGQVVSDLVNTGIYVMERDVLAALPGRTQLDWAADVLPSLVASGALVSGFVGTGYWEDVGTLERYRSVHVDALLGRVDLEVPGFEVSSGVWVSDGVELSPEAVVQGPVLLGRNVKVEAGAVIRGPLVLGDNVVVRTGTVAQRCVVHDNVYIGDQCALHGAIVGRGVDLMRSVRLDDGVVVGNDCVVEEEAVLGPDVRVFPAKTIEAGAVLRQSVIWESRGRRSLFSQNGVSGILNVEVTPELAVRLASAYASTLRKGAVVVTARDQSRGARSLKRAVTAALTAGALDVHDLEHSPLPVARHTTERLGDAGIVVRTTPGEPESIDILLLDADGVDIDEATRRLVDRVYVREEYRRAFPGEIGELTFSQRSITSYVDHVVRSVDLTGVREAGVRVVVDAGHGSAGLVLPSLVGALGVDAFVVNPGLDDTRPADTVEETQAALGRLADLVASSRAAFGVRFDRVGERVRLVDDRGHVVDDDRALLLLVDLVSAEARAGAVALPVTATRVAESVAAFHGVQIRWTGVGADAFARLPESTDNLLLAGDGTGGYVIPSVARTPDGLATFARLVGLVARTRLTLGEIDDRIPRSAVVRTEVRTPWAAKGAVMREVAGVARQRVGTSTDLTEGIKVIYPDGSWCLVVPDPAEALVRLWAEADTLEESRHMLAGWSEVVARAAR
jgi:mannose-1-phosphate guanylyltransferase / phosphomannomutase